MNVLKFNFYGQNFFSATGIVYKLSFLIVLKSSAIISIFNFSTTTVSVIIFFTINAIRLACINRHTVLLEQEAEAVPMIVRAKFRIVITISVIIALFIVLILVRFYKHCLRDKKGQPASKITTTNGNIFSIWNYDGKLAYQEIVRATNNFDNRYCIGTGGYGSVYRARLPNGKVVALKKLHTSEAEEPTLMKSFMNELKS
ncbi:hypothetical protein FNV43_RR10472 [Rhamnella rubrinervis]|uniref:non-specific serine/threonine protein kinase n=1 Tax=Rhamnella rubrinervis TaxID=2594499 RepID=A0A8K0HC99_9ROSA|nr:hypothetical protein FNV43_RR10472 [Rhamnella rubrinervis]